MKYFIEYIWHSIIALACVFAIEFLLFKIIGYWAFLPPIALILSGAIRLEGYSKPYYGKCITEAEKALSTLKIIKDDFREPFILTEKMKIDAFPPLLKEWLKQYATLKYDIQRFISLKKYKRKDLAIAEKFLATYDLINSDWDELRNRISFGWTI